MSSAKARIRLAHRPLRLPEPAVPTITGPASDARLGARHSRPAPRHQCQPTAQFRVASRATVFTSVPGYLRSSTRPGPGVRSVHSVGFLAVRRTRTDAAPIQRRSWVKAASKDAEAEPPRRRLRRTLFVVCGSFCHVTIERRDGHSEYVRVRARPSGVEGKRRGQPKLRSAD